MNLDLRNRAPSVERLPDSRQRVTRVYDVINPIPKTPASILALAWIAWGTADATYTTCRLVAQSVSGQPTEFPDRTDRPPVLTRVYEEISATAETQVGNAGISYDQYGNKITTLEYLQFSTNAFVPGTVGTSTAPSDASSFLKEVISTDDGTLRRIKRIYTDAGQLSQVDETKNNGALLLRTLTWLKTAPDTPSGYTLITQNVEYIEGLPVYRYTYAKGDGQISVDDQTKNNGALLLRTIRHLTAPGASNPISTPSGYTAVDLSNSEQDGYELWTATFAKGDGEISRDIDYSQSSDQGTTGVTRTTIRHLVAPAATIQPTTLAGSTLISQAVAEQDGYRIWTTVWAKGTGLVVTNVEKKNNNLLIIYNRTALGAVPATPDATIGGTVALIADNVRKADGFDIYERTWAEGIGEISRDIDYSQSSDQGTTGVTRTTIKYLVAPAGTVQPTSLSGSVEIGRSVAEQDGYRVWTTVWAKGTGQVVTGVDTKENGKLIVYRRTALGGAPTTPDATIGGTVTLISTNVRKSDGFDIYDYVWAEGFGEVSRSVQYNQSSDAGTTGATVWTLIHLTVQSETTDPTSAPSGTVKIASVPNVQDGYRVWTVTYAKGTGTVMTNIDIKNNGALYLQTIRALGAAPSTPTDYTLIGTSVRESDGYKIYEYQYAKGVGEISRDIRYGQSTDEGTTGATITTIRYIVAPSGTIQPTSLSGSVLIAKDVAEQDGSRIWTTIWAKGTGLVAQAIHARQDGLREVTNISLGTKVAPSGVVIRDDYRIDDGFNVYTTTAIQAADGTTAVTSVSFSFERYVPFLYPGRAKAYTITAQNGWEAYDVFRSPPVKTDVKATITVSYQTSNALGTISNYWNPSEWATIRAEWIGLNNIPGFAVVAMPGYRSVSATPLTFTAGVWEDGMAGTMLGNVVYGDTTAKLTVAGGPDDPGGDTLTLDATIEPAFTSYDGTVYYRKTLVTATIPAQDALPV